jgi:hypothetical protein
MAAKRLPCTEYLIEKSDRVSQQGFQNQQSDLLSVDPTIDANEALAIPGGGWETSAPTIMVGSFP